MIGQLETYSVSYRRGARINGHRGCEYVVRTADGDIVRMGWSPDGKAGARKEAAAALREMGLERRKLYVFCDGCIGHGHHRVLVLGDDGMLARGHVCQDHNEAREYARQLSDLLADHDVEYVDIVDSRCDVVHPGLHEALIAHVRLNIDRAREMRP